MSPYIGTVKMGPTELIPLISGAVAVLSTWLAANTRIKAKQVEADLKNEAELLRNLTGSQEAMRFQIEASIKREAEMMARMVTLEAMVRERDMALRELTLRYEALRENHAELAERHRQSERDNVRLRDELLKHYLDSEARKTVPPPAKYP